ncbi:MAG: site-2 protease family protein [Nevskia sp.]|nr:site-2 protease family protein [Nevskia sp.]
MNGSLDFVQTFAIWALPVVFAITLHEVAHGWVARWLGDDTAARQRRLSLNPLRHIDPVGTILVPGILVLLHAGFLMGWAKPVPVDARNFRKPLQDMALVAVAGPLANLAMAIAWGLVFKFAAAADQGGAVHGLALMGRAGLLINVSLMVLNLLPLPPLDGGRVLVGVLPPRLAHRVARLEPYGMLILAVLAYEGLLGAILYWPHRYSMASIAQLLGLHSS